MAKKAGACLLLLVLGLAAGYVIGRRGSRPDPAYWVSKAEYDAASARAEAQHRADEAQVMAARAVIEAKDTEIARILAAAAAPSPAELEKDAEIAALESKVAAYEAQGDLAGALAASKAENAAWAEKFSLAAGMHQESLSALNKAWQAKFDAQVVITNSAVAYGEREHALRLWSDDLRARLEGRVSSGRIWKYVALGEPIVFSLIAILGGK